MPENWHKEELETAELDNQRLNERFKSILDALTARPNVSIPTGCGGRNELEAAYRFIENPKITPKKILRRHAS